MARAVTAPSSLLLAGAGASAAILAGASLPLAAAAGALAWVGRVALARPRRPPREDIDPSRLDDPWRSMVVRAMGARDRFRRVAGTTAPGPLRERLDVLAGRLDTAIAEAWAVAQRGNALDEGLDQLDVDRIRSEIAQLGRQRKGSGGERAATARALGNQLEAAERMASVADGARARLLRLNAQLDEAVTRALEVSLQAADAGALQPLGSDIEGLVGELEALHQALDEAGGT